jgi:hypothetical protein
LRAGSSGWRAVDDEGEVLDLLVQRRRDKAAVEKLMRKLLRKGVNIRSRNTPKGQFDPQHHDRQGDHPDIVPRLALAPAR